MYKEAYKTLFRNTFVDTSLEEKKLSHAEIQKRVTHQCPQEFSASKYKEV